MLLCDVSVQQTSLSFTMFTDEHHEIPPWQSLSAGFMSGAISRTCTHPMERASLVMRASTDGAGLPTVLKRMVADGGPLTLWRGNGANICQVGPEMAINFMVYDVLKKQVRGPQPSATRSFGNMRLVFGWTVRHRPDSSDCFRKVSVRLRCWSSSQCRCSADEHCRCTARGRENWHVQQHPGLLAENVSGPYIV